MFKETERIQLADIDNLNIVKDLPSSQNSILSSNYTSFSLSLSSLSAQISSSSLMLNENLQNQTTN
jgi:hypothetical protein